MELVTKPLSIDNSECDILLSKMGNIDLSGTVVRGPGGDQGPEFITIPFGIYQPEDDEPPQGHTHFASACVFASMPAYSKVLQAVSGTLLGLAQYKSDR